jgi:2'-5' RNA ligase
MGRTAYGVYLIPPPELAYQLALAHLTLKSAFGLEAGGKFMPHCTLFAFLHLREGLTEQALIEILDQVLPEYRSFPLNFKLETDRFIRLQIDQQPELMSLQTTVRQALWPLLSEYGQKRRSESAFHPHMTLAFRDLPAEPGLLKQVEAFCQKFYENMPKTKLWANLIQLVEFKVQDEAEWDSPDYWRSLSWRIIKGYAL